MNEINALFDQAQELESQGKYEAAEPIYVHALKLKEAKFGPEFEELGTDYYNVGLLFFAQEKYEAAESYLVRSLKFEERALGADHPELLCTLEHLAETYFNQENYEKAEKYYRRFLDLHAKTRGHQGTEVVRNLHNLAEISELLGKSIQANDLRLQAQQLLDAEMTSAYQRKAS